MSLMRRASAVSLVVLGLAACAGRDEPVFPTVETEFTVRPPGRYELMNSLPSGRVIRYTLYVPSGTTGSVPLIVAMHFGGQVFGWYGGAFADILVIPGLASVPAVIVAADAGSINGWSGSDEGDVMWLAEEIAKVYPIDRKRVAITGYSAGGAQTWQLANRHQDFFTAAIPMSARPRTTEQKWRIPVYVIHSRNDELTPIETVEAYVAAEQSAGAPMALHAVTGISHYQTPSFVPSLQQAAAWLAGVWR
jgi:poly(3-hydroxybutyrate) depolymerase